VRKTENTDGAANASKGQMNDKPGPQIGNVVKKQIENRPDEWKIEQGINAAKLPFLDQTGPEPVFIEPKVWDGKMIKDEAAIKAVGDPGKLFTRELEGWKG
jgi:sulfite oxidase